MKKHNCCPWCDVLIEPMNTAEHLDTAIFEYGSASDPKHVARNPLMCPNCEHVFGAEDFYPELTAEANL